MKLLHLYLLLLPIVSYMLSYFDGHMLPPFAGHILTDPHLTRLQFGLLTGGAFVAV